MIKRFNIVLKDKKVSKYHFSKVILNLLTTFKSDIESFDNFQKRYFDTLAYFEKLFENLTYFHITPFLVKIAIVNLGDDFNFQGWWFSFLAISARGRWSPKNENITQKIKISPKFLMEICMEICMEYYLICMGRKWFH